MSQTPFKLKHFFAIILIFCHPSEVSILWESFKKYFCEDILYYVRCRRNDNSITYSEYISNKNLMAIKDKVVTRR